MNTYALIFHCDSLQDRVSVELCDKNKTLQQQSVEFTHNDTQSLFETAVQLLDKEGIQFSNIAAIGVIEGAERFTIARLTTVIANAIAWSMRIPIHSFTKKPSWEKLLEVSQQPINALYSKEPTMH